MMVRRLWPFRWMARHAWVYQLNPGDRLALVYVATDIGDDRRQLIYQGHLIDFGLGEDGRFTYLVLQSPTRRYLVHGDPGPTVTPPTTLSLREGVHASGVSTSTEGFLLIEGSHVKNFFFRPNMADLSRGAEEVDEALKKAGPPRPEVVRAPEMLEPSEQPPAVRDDGPGEESGPAQSD